MSHRSRTEDRLPGPHGEPRSQGLMDPTIGTDSNDDGSARILGVLDPMLVLSIGVAIRFFCLSFYTPFILIYLHSGLGLPYVTASSYLSLPSVAALIFPIWGGGLTDRFGRRRLVILSLAAEACGIATFAVGIHYAALAGIIGGLFAARAAGTVGSPSVSAYIADVNSPARRTVGFAWLRSAQNLGFSIGVAAGGGLLLVLSFGQLAVLAALIAACGVLFSAILLPVSPHDRTVAESRKFALQETSGNRGNSGRGLRGIAQSFQASIRALRHDRALLLFWATSCFLWMLIWQFAYAVPAFASSGLGVSYLYIGVALALNGAVPVLSQVPLTRTLTGRAMTRVGLWGLLAYTIAFFGMGLEGVVRVLVIPVLFVLVIVMTLGENLVAVPLFTLPMNIAPKAERGAYSGAMSTAGGVGSIIVPSLTGFALGFEATPLVTWTMLVLPVVPAAVLLRMVRSRVSPASNKI